MLTELRINPERMRADFEHLARIGSTGDGGVHRPTFSEAHLEARAWFRGRIQDIGLEFRHDGAGNHSGFLACGPRGAPTLLLGSHLDSVPYGGPYDGALGVMAALEALRVVLEASVTLPVHLEAIDFTDEEGTFLGELGSNALAGRLSLTSLEQIRTGRAALTAGLERAGLDEEGLMTARRDPETLAGYLELHIEQGKRLFRAPADIGIVTSIVGIGSYRLGFIGRADHAGTTPLEDRKDAALGASAFTLAVPEITRNFDSCTANVGDIRLAPGAFNIVPKEATLALEFRSPDSAQMDELEALLIGRARVEAERRELGLTAEPLSRVEPATMDPQIQDTISEVVSSLGLSGLSLSSFAGHDAQSMAPVCPTGMIFVPSVHGASHSPREFTRWEDCIDGANVLLLAALTMARDKQT